LQRFAPLLEPNPRAMKRFVNDYSVLRAVRTLESNTVQADPLALWAVIETRWPALADYLRAHPDAIQFFTEPTSNVESISAEIRQLFEDQTVQSLANFEYGGPLTPELIQACCGTAVSETDQESAQERTSQADN
jgi:hypothetical protein